MHKNHFARLTNTRHKGRSLNKMQFVNYAEYCVGAIKTDIKMSG